MRFLTTKSLLIGALGLALFAIPTDALRALGLGEARVGSYLGQPLDISVRLLEADAMALDTLTVAPATPADHDRLGVPSEALALGLEVTVDRRVDPPQLRIRSRRNVSDPVVQILIDARWSSGRVLREYTLFLDPPLMDVAPPVTRPAPETRPAERPEERPAERPVETAPEPAARPTPPRPAPEARPEPEPRPEPAPEPRPAPRDDVVGPITSGQTLWGVAAAWRPDTSLTMNQVMLAIFERNPQAFIDGNVNRLRRGAELSMPDIATVRATSAAEADRRIRDQMQAWRQETRRADVPVIADTAVPDVERTPAPAPEPVPPEIVHRLEVVPPEQEMPDDGPVVSAEEIQQANNRIRRLEDQMYAEELETDEFYRDIESIRDAIDTGEAAGLAVADEEMAQLEARLRDARLAREEADRLLAEATPTEEDDVSAYFRQLEDELGGVDEAVTEPAIAAEDDPAVAEEAPAVAATEPLRMAPMDDQRSVPVWLWILALVVVLAVVVGAILVLRARRSSATPAVEDAGVALTRARARVASRPEDLTAHLALLRVLHDRDDSVAFSAALDDMYRHVDDDGNPTWAQALQLAATSAPDHPLLTPPETRRIGEDDDDGLDDRTREMLGILEDDSTSADDYQMDAEIDVDEDIETDRDIFSRDDEDDQVTRIQPAPVQVDETEDDEEIEGVDLDLAELSDRLDSDEPDEAETTEAGTGYEFDFSDRAADDALPGDAAERADEPATAEDDSEEMPAQSVDPDMSDFERDLLGTAGELDEDDLDFSGVDEEDQVGEREEMPDSDDELEAFLRADDSDEEALSGARDSDDDAAPGDSASADEVDEPGEVTLGDDDAEVKLDLARAYLSMDDPESARTLLEEILAGGSAGMREQARQLLDSID
ncbi:MAG: hypothetical protein EA370_09600 [Wenzhouxiangella sp.]|nr:MAG: hypothetical protein EA370_09600 [Wenzhouxiangella sp.]